MDKIEPSYYSILPAPVRYDKRLTPNAKILYAEITSLTNKLGFCYASNRYFEDLYKVSTQSINFWLQQLEKNGYINRIIYRDKGTKEILNRYITIFEKPIQENFNRPIQEILIANNKALNNKSNYYLKKKSSKKTNTINANPRKK
ncbi:helix-turn-helix domain-containing protein [Cellulophaga sp. HaHa_2_1]|uniref:helix-turn-helix domain-containing protein n=1 Tax=Cellulophaga sp. HaHa_2_1 TaxID=2749994 RepID=UPI001C4E6E44|nr:helix-turn-helix domain-containing protein [Cellulophaga sp. HaHa_2_1]QXP52552.1 helix-turn-helix domain-containing protein [Cellulophaga sp. HaHa_2_1]